jgi:hypothetical protein
MKKIIILGMALIASTHYAKEPSLWRHNGIYIVNKTDGSLKVRWDNQEKDIESQQKALIPINRPHTEIKISYSNTVPAFADFPTCRGGAQTSLRTGKKIVLYEIHGGHDDGKGPFNRPGRGAHCAIHVHHQAFTPKTAIQRYPELK